MKMSLVTALLGLMLTSSVLSADDFIAKLKAKLPNDAQILGSPRSVAGGGTRVFYVHIEKPQADTFTLTCTLMEGGNKWYCSRGAAATPNPMPFVVNE